MYLTKDFEQLISILLVSAVCSPTGMHFSTLKLVCILSFNYFHCLPSPNFRNCLGWKEATQWWKSTWLSLAILSQHRPCSSGRVSAWLCLILYLVSVCLLWDFFLSSFLFKSLFNRMLISTYPLGILPPWEEFRTRWHQSWGQLVGGGGVCVDWLLWCLCIGIGLSEASDSFQIL